MFHNKSPRPVLTLPRSGPEVALEALAAVGLIASFAIVLMYWSQLPERIPTHFGFSGQPDAWGSPMTLWMMPGISAALYAMLTVVSLFPHKFNYLHTITEANAEGHYRLARGLLLWIKVLIMVLFAWLTWQICAIALERSTQLNKLFLPLLLGGIMLTLLVYLVRATKVESSAASGEM